MSIITSLKQSWENCILYTFDYNKKMYKYQIVSTAETKEYTKEVIKRTLMNHKHTMIKLITTRPEQYTDLAPNIIVASLQEIIYENVYWKNPNCQIYIFDIEDDGLLSNETLNEILECDSLTIIPDTTEDDDLELNTFTILNNPQKPLVADYDSNLTYFGLIIDEWVNAI